MASELAEEVGCVFGVQKVILPEVLFFLQTFWFLKVKNSHNFNHFSLKLKQTSFNVTKFLNYKALKKALKKKDPVLCFKKVTLKCQSTKYKLQADQILLKLAFKKKNSIFLSLENNLATLNSEQQNKRFWFII